jgi:hypothetical protein
MRQILFFFIAWGCVMSLLVWRGADLDGSFILAISSTVALLFGFIMSVYYKSIPKLLEDADSEARSDVRLRRDMKRRVIPFSNVVTQIWLSSEPPVGPGER